MSMVKRFHGEVNMYYFQCATQRISFVHILHTDLIFQLASAFVKHAQFE